MARVTEDEVRSALSAVVDQDTGQNLIDSNMIAGLVVKDGNVGFAIEVDANQGAAKEPLRQAAESAVNALPGVLSVTAVLTAHQAAGKSSEAPQEAAQPAAREQPASPDVPGVGTIIAVASGKGGVGKSTTATNLALALADPRPAGRPARRRHLWTVPAAA